MLPPIRLKPFTVAILLCVPAAAALPARRARRSKAATRSFSHTASPATRRRSTAGSTKTSWRGRQQHRRFRSAGARQHGGAERANGRPGGVRRSLSVRGGPLLRPRRRSRSAPASAAAAIFRPATRSRIGLDPRHDRLTGYVFTANPSGVQSDIVALQRHPRGQRLRGGLGSRHQRHGRRVERRVQNSVFPDSIHRARTATARSGDCRSGATCGSNRRVGSLERRPRGTQGNVSRFGTLIFDDRLSPPRRIELLPFYARAQRAQLGRRRWRRHGVRCRSRHARRPRNIDDAVGDDQSRLRPGRARSGGAEPVDIRNVLSGKAAVFSRGQPRVSVAVRSVSDVPFASHRRRSRPVRSSPTTKSSSASPDQTTILGATKLSGKANGWTYGGLGAVTAREYATHRHHHDRRERQEIVTRGRTPDRAGDHVRRRPRAARHPERHVDGRAPWRHRSSARRTSTRLPAAATSTCAGTKTSTSGTAGVYAARAPIDGVQKTDIAAVTNFSYIGKQLGSRRPLRSRRQEFPQHRSRVSEYARRQELGLRRRPRRPRPIRGSSAGSPTCTSTPTSSGTPTGLSIFENINWYVETTAEELLVHRIRRRP